MAAEDQGIMSLPMEGQAPSQPMPQMPLEESFDAVKQGLQNASPQAAADVQQLMASIMPQLDQLSDEELNAFLQTIQYLYEGGEKEYAKRLQEVIATGVLDEGDLPEEYDPEVLSSIGVVLLEAIRSRQGGAAAAEASMPPAAQFARGGIADAARIVAGRGRSGDTMLAHINADEAKMLRRHGGMGTINPKTGLPEYGFFSDLWKGVKDAVKGVVKGVTKVVKQIVKSPVGRILATAALATFLGPGALGITGLGLSTGVAGALASGAVTALGGGNAKQILTSAATAFFGAPGGAVSQYVGAAGITNAAANAAVTAGIVGTGAGLLTGQKLSDAVKSGLTAGAVSGLTTGVTQGFGTRIPGAEQNYAPVEDAVVKPVEQVLTPNDVSAQVRSGGVGAETSPVQPQPQLTPTPLGPVGAAPVAGATPMAQGITPPGAVAPPVDVGGPLQLPPGAAPEAGYTVAGGAPGTPGMGESFQRMAGGIGDLVQGKPGAWETVKQGASDLFMPKTMTPAELQGTEVFQNARAAGATYTEAMRQASAAYNPSVFRTYAPAAAAGLGIAALTGAFKPSPVPPSPLAQQLGGSPGTDLINKNPSQYLVQGLPGVQYDERGNIVGSSSWSPSGTMADVRVATPNYYGGQSAGIPSPFAPAAPMYTPGAGTLGLARGIAQPGNTAGAYTNLIPRATGYDPYGYFTAADGGLASLARGGYPRKTGAISGPGTEKSDSIPAMLSDGEFVMTAKAVRGAGGGSRREGAKKMYALMHQLERNASRG